MADNDAQYADGYHEIFGDSDSDDEDFYFEGFAADKLSPDSADSDSEDSDGEEEVANNFVREDPFANVYQHAWLMDFTEQAGLQVDIGDEPSELDVLKAVFSDHAFAYMVLETNRYAREQIAKLRNAGCLRENSRANNWTDTNITEMKAWIGLVLLMGHTCLLNYYAYWSTNVLTKQPIFGKTMTRDHFLSIFQFFDLCDNNQALPVDHENHD